MNSQECSEAKRTGLTEQLYIATLLHYIRPQVSRRERNSEEARASQHPQRNPGFAPL